MVIAYCAIHINDYSEQCLDLFLTLTLPGSQKKKHCRSNISRAPLLPKGFTCLPCWVKSNCYLIAHNNTIQQCKAGCEGGNIVCCWKDKGSQCQQMQLPDVNFGQGGQGKHSFKKCHGIFHAWKLLQAWHPIVFKVEFSGAPNQFWGWGPGLHGLTSRSPPHYSERRLSAHLFLNKNSELFWVI